MNHTNRVVRLLVNELYPTYQFYGYMGNEKTSPKRGLQIGARTAMVWLAQRLPEDVPEEIRAFALENANAFEDNAKLFSYHLDCGFVVDILDEPDKGTWTMQITEPDLGSDPGNAEQRRGGVLGRIFTTNIGFYIDGDRLACGFKTVVSDPGIASEPAEVYRLAVVRRLVENPEFGLRQITAIDYEWGRIETAEQLKRLGSIWRDTYNQLPIVLFTQMVEEEPQMPSLPQLSSPMVGRLGGVLPPLPVVNQQRNRDPDYDIDGFSRSGVTLWRTYLLDEKLRQRCGEMMGMPIQSGDILLLEPTVFDGKKTIISMKNSHQRRLEALGNLKAKLKQYPRGRSVDFGKIIFLSSARQRLMYETEQLREDVSSTSAQQAQRIRQLEQQWRAEVEGERKLRLQKEEEVAALRQKWVEAQGKLRETQDQRLGQTNLQLEQLRRQLAEKDSEIAYCRRKLSAPTQHNLVAPWVAEQFDGRLVIHAKAVELMKDTKGLRGIDVGQVCDALDFLATDYWENRYGGMDADEMRRRCSAKYGRPFSVKPTGSNTIEFTPTEYKIKYTIGRRGKPVDTPLDWHLGIGNDPEHLIRIYFLHDDEKRCIVIGSLPKHLTAITVS